MIQFNRRKNWPEKFCFFLFYFICVLSFKTAEKSKNRNNCDIEKQLILFAIGNSCEIERGNISIHRYDSIRNNRTETILFESHRFRLNKLLPSSDRLNVFQELNLIFVWKNFRPFVGCNQIHCRFYVFYVIVFRKFIVFLHPKKIAVFFSFRSVLSE